MTTYADIVNRGLQAVGTRTTITAAQLAASSNNESKQANVILYKLRDELLRLAPWDCCRATANLTYITSQPGTPENQSPYLPTWTPGQPAPPWLYEYQYPVDCLRAVKVVAGAQSGFGGAVPIFPVPTGNAWGYNAWTGPPVRFEVATDKFRPVTAAAVVAGGTGYAVGDQITLPRGLISVAPIGAPVVLQVLTAPAGVIATVAVVNQVQGQDGALPLGGSYFSVQPGTILQAPTTGVGTGATFALTQGPVDDQRVVLCNQEFATLQYCRQVVNPNVFDDLFQKAYSNALGAILCVPLSGDKQLIQMCVQRANEAISAARQVDGNEGLVINDYTPDWLRVRGVGADDGNVAGNVNFNWGAGWSPW